MIKGILFDFDGTLINTNDLIRESLDHVSMDYRGRLCTEEEIQDIWGKPLVEQVAVFAKEGIDEMVDAYRNYYRARMDVRTTIFEGIKELIEALHEGGIRQAILSNKGSRGIRHGLEAFDLNHYFDPVLSSEDVEKRKPDPEGVRMILEAWGFDPEEVLLVGDSPHDLRAARAAGVGAVLVGWSALRIPSSSYDHKIDRPEALLDLISD